MQHIEKRGGVHTGFWRGNLRERDQLGDPGLDERIILNGTSGSRMGEQTGLGNISNKMWNI